MQPFVDVAKHQGDITFRKMRENNVKGVIIRAGNGVAPDPRFAEYVAGAHDEGLAVGVYWFCNPKMSSGPVQGKLLAAAHRRAGAVLPPMMDVEKFIDQPGPMANALFGSKYATWLHQMADTSAQDADRDPMIYTNEAYWDGPSIVPGVPNVGDDSFGKYDLVCARYPFFDPFACALHVPPLDASKWGDWILNETPKRPRIPQGWDDWNGWQFSGDFNRRGRAYGVSSDHLDLDIATDEAWARWTGNTTPEDDMKLEYKNDRVLDTRDHNGHPVKAGQTIEVRFLAQNVFVNITVVNPAGDGHLVAWGAGPKPETGNIVFHTGQSVSNFALVHLEPGTGTMHLQATADCHLVVDMQAYEL